MFQEIADELGISVGAAWNYINGNHKNEKREPHKQAVPPQPGVIPKEVSLPAMKVNTVPQYPVESNTLRPEDDPVIQALRAIEQQKTQREQNQRVAVELLTQQVEDLKQDTTRDFERKEEFARKITELERLWEKTQRERQDLATIAILEMNKNQINQVFNKPKESSRETQSDNENRKPSEEQGKVKIPITEPESPHSNIKIDNPDTLPEGLIIREKPLVKPPETKTKNDS
jgi:hypothetical protein